jgi:hypothetical protein
MNGKTTKMFGWAVGAAIGGLTLVAAGMAGCTDGTTATVAYAYDYPYVYASYYPVDTAYAGYYWADSWNYYTFYYEGAGATGVVRNALAVPPYNPGTGVGGTTGSGGRTGAGGATGAGGMLGAAGHAGTGGSGGAMAGGLRSTLASVVEALARGENVCAGQVTITPKNTTPACSGGTSAQERNGVTLVFNNCKVQDATINGTFDVTANRSASEQTCSPTTVITLNHTTTITNLSISDANGKITIPMQTDTGMTTYTFGQTPTKLTFSTNGEIQISDASGAAMGDLTYTGMDTVTLSGNTSYTVDGSTTVMSKNDNAMATITKTGLTRSGGCCRPISGSFMINRTGGSNPGQATWTFGPSCGTVMRNNTSVTLPACI